MKTFSRPRFTGIGLISIATLAAAVGTWEMRNFTSFPLGFMPVAISRPSEAPPATTRLPFVLDDFVRYFQESLAQAPQERRYNYAFFRGGSEVEHFYTIAISANGPNLLIKFEVLDDYGMNIVREFFEAPFFQGKESEHLYSLLYLGDGIRTINLPRFDVVFQSDNRAEHTVLSLTFSPRTHYVGKKPTGD